MDTAHVLVNKIIELEEKQKNIKSEIATAKMALLSNINGEKIYSTLGKEYGEMTHELADGVKIKIKRTKTVKHDKKLMINAASSLSWDEAKEFFDIKFDITEAGFGRLSGAALDSEKYSDVLSRVEDAREVKIGELQISKVEVV